MAFLKWVSREKILSSRTGGPNLPLAGGAQDLKSRHWVGFVKKELGGVEL